MTRHESLEAAAAGIRVRRGGRIPVEKILLAAAAVLFPLGLVFVLLGWEGAAHTGRTYAQLDYLISGGIFGLGLSVAGGFMYFGYWLSRQLSESRRQSTQTLQALQRVEDLLEASLRSRVSSNGFGPSLPTRSAAGGRAVPPEAGAESADRAPAGRSARRGPDQGAGRTRRRATEPRPHEAPAEAPTGQMPALAGPILFATPRGNLLHRPECPVVARREDLREVAAGTAGFGYCAMCDAAGVPER